MTRTDLPAVAPDIDRYLEPFEAARGAGDDPDLGAFLPPADHPDYLPVLRELVRVDLEFAWDVGEGRRLETYRDRFPVLFADAESARAVAWEEFRLREAAGEDPTPAEYRDRFGVDLSALVRTGPESTAPLTSSESTAFEVRSPATAERYELLEELARGGMGIVYRARDRALHREVAVKALRDPDGPVPGAARRLAEEARITGRLQHPGVPAVHDLGTLPDGRPFLAMRLVGGRTLAAMLTARPDPGDDRSRFVAAFEQVCQTVAYAHANGVIHRDLKPSNVMVGAFGEVQVMDWGLAKVVDRQQTRDPRPESDPAGVPWLGSRVYAEEGATQAGSVLGTPAYMPPEQARGLVDRLDERSDVFGLGGILSVLLTGQPPFVGPDASTVHGRAARADLTEAFARLDVCGAEPALVELCKRCLSPDPGTRPKDAGEVADAVTAFRAAADDRARQAEVEIAAAEVRAAEERKRLRTRQALTMSLLVMVLGGGLAAWAWEREVRRHRERTEKERVAIHQVVGEAVERAYRDMDRGRWADARASVTRAVDRTAGEPAPAEVRELVAGARADLETGLALEEARIARTNRRPGESRFDDERAEAEFEAAFRRYGLPIPDLSVAEAAARVRAARLAPTLVVALDEWSTLPPEPRKSHLRAVAQAADDDPWRARLRDLRAAKDKPGLATLARDPRALAQPPATIHLLALSLSDADRVSLLKAAQPLHPTDFWINFTLGQSLNRVRRSVEGVAPLTAAVALRPESLGAWISLASAHVQRGDDDGALAACRVALGIDPTEPLIHLNRAVVLKRKGQLPEAIAAVREAIRLDPQDARAHNNLGTALDAAGDRIGAEVAYRKALELDPKSSLAHLNLGLLERARGNRAEAIERIRTAADLDPNDARAPMALGEFLRSARDFAGAEAAFREAIRCDPRHALAHTTLGSLLRDRGALDEATAAHREAVRVDPRMYMAHLNLGNVLRDRGELEAAAAAYRAAIAIDPKSPRAHAGLGRALADAGDTDGAIAAFVTAAKLLPPDAELQGQLAHARTRKGDWAGAVEDLRAAPDTPGIQAALSRAERRLRMAGQMGDVFDTAPGRLTPRDAIAAAEICMTPVHRQYARAFALYAAALARDPKLAVYPYRLDAARAAVAVAAGKDPTVPVDEEEWHHLMVRAREWLGAVADVAGRIDVGAMRGWLWQQDFAPVRDPSALAAMPSDQRTAWQGLWAEVRRKAATSG